MVVLSGARVNLIFRKPVKQLTRKAAVAIAMSRRGYPSILRAYLLHAQTRGVTGLKTFIVMRRVACRFDELLGYFLDSRKESAPWRDARSCMTIQLADERAEWGGQFLGENRPTKLSSKTTELTTQPSAFL